MLDILLDIILLDVLLDIILRDALVWVEECLVLYHVVYRTNIDIAIIVGKSFINIFILNVTYDIHTKKVGRIYKGRHVKWFFNENMELRCWKTIIIISSYNLNIFTLTMTIS